VIPLALLAGLEIAITAVVGLIAVFLIVRYPILGIYALIVLLPFNGLVSQVTADTAVPTLYGAAKDVILLCLLLVAVISGGLRRVPGVVVALVVGCVVVAMLSVFSTEDFVQASYGWRNDYEPLLLLIVVPAIVHHAQLKRVFAAVILSGQISALIAIATWCLGVRWLYLIGRLPVSTPEEFPTSLFSSGNEWPRAFSPFVAPNEMAVVMAAVLALVWLVPGRRGIVNVGLSVLPLAAIYLSGSRSGILGAVVVLAVLCARAVFARSPLLSILFLLFAAFGVSAGAALYITNRLGDSGDPSIGGHSASMAEGLEMLLEHPWGLGLGLVGPRTTGIEGSFQVESFWLLIALESGVVVLAIFVVLLLVLTRRSVVSRTQMGFIAAAVIAASLVSQLVLPTFQEGAVSFAIWLMVGLSIVAQEHARAEAPTADGRSSDKVLRGGSARAGASVDL